MPRSDNVVFEAVESGPTSAHLLSPINVVCPKVLTTLEITQGFYGKMSNYRKVFDVTAELRQLSFTQGGHKLEIKATDDLAALFRDPARGARKELKVSYTVRGFSGTMRIEESGGFLKSSIQIGYVPEAGTAGAELRESRKVEARRQSHREGGGVVGGGEVEPGTAGVCIEDGGEEGEGEEEGKEEEGKEEGKKEEDEEDKKDGEDEDEESDSTHEAVAAASTSLVALRLFQQEKQSRRKEEEGKEDEEEEDDEDDEDVSHNSAIDAIAAASANGGTTFATKPPPTTRIEAVP